MNRREFHRALLQHTAAFSLAGAAGLSFTGKSRPALRFAVASDGHFGQPNTDYERFATQLVEWLNREHKARKLDFVVLNGDLTHDRPEHLTQLKPYLERLSMPWWVTRGNHDRVDEAHWRKLWGYGTNHHFRIGQVGIVLLDTSNEAGEYICPTPDTVQEALGALAGCTHMFIFMHIPPQKWEKHCIDCPQIMELFARTPNLTAVFHGHQHDLDGVFQPGPVPHFFDGHYGGNWGKDYLGFRLTELSRKGVLTSVQLSGPDRQTVSIFPAGAASERK